MKADIHPDYHEITVVMTDGSEFTTRSTWGKPGDKLRLDVDPKTHPAWVGGVHIRKAGQVEKFNKRFAHFGLGGEEEKSSGDNTDTPAEEKADG